MANMQERTAIVKFVGEVYTNDEGKRKQDIVLDAGKGEFDMQLGWSAKAQVLVDGDVGKTLNFKIAKGRSGYYGWVDFGSGESRAPKQSRRPAQKQKANDSVDWDAKDQRSANQTGINCAVQLLDVLSRTTEGLAEASLTTATEMAEAIARWIYTFKGNGEEKKTPVAADGQPISDDIPF